jgi:hypothetical protein
MKRANAYKEKRRVKDPFRSTLVTVTAPGETEYGERDLRLRDVG